MASKGTDQARPASLAPAAREVVSLYLFALTIANYSSRGELRRLAPA